MLFIKAFTSYFHIYRPPLPSAVASPIVRHPSDCASTSSAITHRIAPTAQYTAMRKTAEERFNMLARGWLAYPVTQMHALLPPKSGCINVIPRFALSRRRATALFHNPVCKAQRSVPGFSSTPTSACRRYATSPPSAVASPHRPPSSSYCPIGAMHRHRRNPIRTKRQRRAHGASAGTIYMRSYADRASGHAFS